MKLPRHASSPAASGYTILEVAFASAIALGLLFAIATTTRQASRAYEEGQSRARLVAAAHQALDRIAVELDTARFDSLDPVGTLVGNGSATITFTQAAGYGGGAMNWTAPVSISFQLERDELNDGLDNDGNGLVDEGQIVLVRNVGQADQTTVVLCHGVRSLLQGEVANLGDDNGNGLVDEPGLVFELQGNVVVIRLSLEALGPDGSRVVKTVQTAVRIRN